MKYFYFIENYRYGIFPISDIVRLNGKMQPKGIRWMQLDDAYALSFSIMSLLWAHGQAQFVCAGTTAHALQMVLHLICNNTNNIMVLEHNRNNSIPAPHHIYMYVSVHGVLNISYDISWSKRNLMIKKACARETVKNS